MIDHHLFYIILGFFSCLALVSIAKLLGLLISKKEDYYQIDDK